MSKASTGSVEGFRVEGDKLVEANGAPFVMRGVNHPHVWFPQELSVSLRAIAETGANCVRMVLATGGQWPRTSGSEVGQILAECKANKLIAVLEVHDCTGYGEKPEARPLGEAVDYWLSEDVRAALFGQEAYAIVNIANEPFGNNVPADVYVGENKQAIRRLRASGYKHAIMVDAANWGQDWERIMFHRAEEIFASDSDQNIMFSVHMYEHYGTEEKVRTYLDAFKGRFPLVVGEFAADHGANGDVDELAILKLCAENGQGCLGWSWKGNASPLEGLDIALTWDGELSPWGRTLVDSEHGLRKGTVVAAVFGR
jgi:mannan endo-1,4-beta-mannosidase